MDLYEPFWLSPKSNKVVYGKKVHTLDSLAEILNKTIIKKKEYVLIKCGTGHIGHFAMEELWDSSADAKRYRVVN